LRAKGAGFGVLRGAAGFAAVAARGFPGGERRTPSSTNGERRIGRAGAPLRLVPLSAEASFAERAATAPARAFVVDARECAEAADLAVPAVGGDRFLALLPIE
jgi:hypothetical protein